ncbi:CDP-glucose 4,6-dehydratase [Pedobacter sp. MC2016-14]|uniref:CDP-glucose 4,6-dehydratase n=1 Tax=Pedobacter sp. MC2016-14 TaxID=2897327 RepID=UPI001E5BD8B0|nr:CDP-glucose 4,6-dehydratase [Pedobacter sp. MC2016-14]MCD0486943.1 CDP-glucose 4,6-dehydratase [Pedobacter sp. MC2016-14]
MFNGIYKDKKVLVTGHTGFKGGWLCLWLKSMGAEVFGISDEVYTSPSLFEVAGLEREMTSQLADIRDLEQMKKLIQEIKPDFLFHMAAQPIVKKAFEEPVDTFTTNIIGTANILEALRVADFPCIAVMITSDKCYDNVEWVWGYRETDHLGGKDPYSASKGAAELIIKTYYHTYFKKDQRIKMSSVRAGNVIGGGDWADSRIVPDCFRAWASGEKVIIRSPDATRPWQHVLEPLSGYLRTGELLAATEGKINGEAYNFGPPTDQNYTVLDLLKELALNWNEEDKDILQIEDAKFPESGLLKLNIDKALYDQQWTPTLNFKETAAFTSDWYKHYYQEGPESMLDFTGKQIDAYIKVAEEKGLLWAKN